MLEEKQRILRDLNLNEEDYRDLRKTPEGCYELMHRMLKLPYINIFDSDFFSSIDDKFISLVNRLENGGKDVGPYRQKYEKLFENYNKKKNIVNLECSEDLLEDLESEGPSNLELILLEKSLEKDNS